MKTKYFSVAMVMVVMVAYGQAAMDEMEVDEDEKLHLREKRGYKALTMTLLRGLASDLGTEGSLIRSALHWLAQYIENGEQYLGDAIEVIDEVVNYMDTLDEATCQYFIDAAVRLNLTRTFGHGVCQVVLRLI